MLIPKLIVPYWEFGKLKDFRPMSGDNPKKLIL
jgi:hypothetical protein